MNGTKRNPILYCLSRIVSGLGLALALFLPAGAEANAVETSLSHQAAYSRFLLAKGQP